MKWLRIIAAEKSRYVAMLSGWPAAILTYAGGLLIILGATGYAIGTVLTAIDRNYAAVAGLARDLGALPASLSAPAPRVASAVLGDDEFSQQLRSQTFWKSRRSSSGSSRGQFSPYSRSDLGGSFEQPQTFDLFGNPLGIWGQSSSFSSRTYRTVCVRLCDGFYWPISFATSASWFSQDEAACESSCTSPARLFVYRNPGQEVDDMEDVNGRPYRRLQTAFLYRTSYDASCKCKPHPWEKQAVDRHRTYALEAAGRKGDKAAVVKLNQMRLEAQAVARDRNPQLTRRVDSSPTFGATTDIAPTLPAAAVPAGPEPVDTTALRTVETLESGDSADQRQPKRSIRAGHTAATRPREGIEGMMSLGAPNPVARPSPSGRSSFKSTYNRGWRHEAFGDGR